MINCPLYSIPKHQLVCFRSDVNNFGQGLRPRLPPDILFMKVHTTENCRLGGKENYMKVTNFRVKICFI